MQHVFTEGALGNSLHLLELRQSIARKLICTITGIVLIAHIWLTAYWLDHVDWNTWYATLALMLVAGLSLTLLKNHLQMAQVVWQLGLMAIIAIAVYAVQPAFAFFFILLPLMAVVMAGWVTGLLVWGAVAVLIWWGGLFFFPLPLVERLVIVLASLMSGAIGWALIHSLFIAIHWAMVSFEQARRNTASAREHRAQLMALYKNLDQAYYQLERTNAALVAAWKTIEEAERFKSEFVANVSHELRTPLNLIVGFGEMMLASPESYGGVPLPGRYRSDLNTICRNAQHLLALVDDVLDLTRIEAGKIALAREDTALGDLVADVVGMLREYVTAKGLELQVKVEAGLPLLWIDRLRIRQVLLNLLTNAARHTEQGWLGVSAFAVDDEVVVRVSDTGQGIRKEELSKIFEEFHATQHTLSNRHSGTGLGLPISRKFVELHGGRMGVESSFGEGTCFWFTLPCTPAADQAQPSRPERRPPLVRLGASERIVVVAHEDQRVVSLLKRYLDGYQVVRAATGEEGARLAVEVKALALIAAETELVPALPEEVILVRCPLPSGRTAATHLGASELLVKPVARQELLAAVERLERPVRQALIVDDEPEMVRLLRKMLRGYIPAQACLEAYSGAEAFDLLDSEPIDLVLLDLVMPEVDGRAVLAHMAADPRLASIPVILVSATGQERADLHLSGSIQIDRSGRFELGEIVHTLGAVFNALAPGWQHLASGLISEGDPAVPPASTGRPLPPAPSPAAAHSAPNKR